MAGHGASLVGRGRMPKLGRHPEWRCFTITHALSMIIFVRKKQDKSNSITQKFVGNTALDVQYVAKAFPVKWTINLSKETRCR